MAKGLIDKLLDEIFDAEWVGRHGEKLTVRELKWLQLFGRNGKILKNVYFPKANGETSEVDVIYITQKGIFVFESKNYSGWIFGDEKSQYWTSMLPNKTKNRFYNPIKQNQTHLKWMREFVGQDVPLFSIIVFSERCELKKVEVQSQDIKVIKRDLTYATVRSIWDSTPDAVSDERIRSLYDQLKTLTNVNAAVKETHIASIERKFKTDKSEKIESRQSENAVSVDEEIQMSEDISELECASLRENAPELEGTSARKKATELEVPLASEKINPSEVEDIEEETLSVSAPLICPRCGGEMIIRTAQKGNNAGKKFWGCGNFPRCRYIKNLE